MSETLRTDEQFLKKLAVMLDEYTIGRSLVDDAEEKKKANSLRWNIMLYFCKLARRGQGDPEFARKLSSTLHEIMDESRSILFYEALCGMLSVEHEDPPIRIPTDLVDRVNLETLERSRDSLEKEVVEKIERESVREEKNRMWA